MHLTWAICHHDGREKGWLWEREGGEVTVALNDQRTARVTASLEEDVAGLVHPGRTRLKVHCHPVAGDPGRFLLFNGLFLEPRALGTRVELAAVDQSARLLNASPAKLPVKDDVPDDTWDPIEGTDAELMMELINRSDNRRDQLQAEAEPGKTIPTLGIRSGSLEDNGESHEHKVSDAKTTWDHLRELSERDRAPDFELEPLDRDDGVHAQLNTYHPRQGANRRDEVILEYGHNLSDFAYEPSGVELCNRYVLVGKGRRLRPVYVAENRQSIGQFGVWQRVEAAPDVKNPDVLERRAKEYVAKHAFHVNFVDATPTVQIGGTAVGFVRNAQGDFVVAGDEWAIPPAFGPPGSGLGFAYWIGDTITVRAKDQFNLYVDKEQPGPATDMYARVTAATFSEIDDDANVLVAHELSPVIPAAHVGGYASEIRTDAI